MKTRTCLSSLLLIPLLLPQVAAAQLPITLQERPGAPFVIYPYDQTLFHVPLTPGDWAFIANNKGPTESQAYIEENGKRLAQANYQYETLTGFKVEHDGTYDVRLYGRGDFSLVDPTIVSGLMSNPSYSLSKNLSGRFAMAVGAPSEGTVCFMPSAPTHMSTYSYRLAPLGNETTSGPTTKQWPKLHPIYVFLDPVSGSSTVNVTAAGGSLTCPPPVPFQGTGAPGAGGRSPGISAPLGFLLLLWVAAHGRGFRFRR
jgi:hypothetical protein